MVWSLMEIMAKKRNVMFDANNLKGIFLSRNRAEELDNSGDGPEIENKFKAGYTLTEIASEHCYSDYIISEHIARGAIWELLKSRMSHEELTAHAYAHRVASSRRNGKIVGPRSYEEGTGAFGMNARKRKEASQKGGRKGGAIAGRKNYENRVGLFSGKLDFHEVGRHAARKRGQVPYEDEDRRTEFGKINEKTYVMALKESDNCYSWKDIGRKVNLVFRNARNYLTLRSMYNQSWKHQDGNYKCGC
jgi:hypothetical protein